MVKYPDVQLYGEVKIQIVAFIISVLNGCGWPTSCSSRFNYFSYCMFVGGFGPYVIISVNECVLL